ncbi:hypothetical protein KYI13_12365 (plasmid) [Macrococcoides bohemicum]|uniref:hypothetical protein n=1 Tax=Macrococcoides bohemicum TaxID=1903056 RepID=UPI001C5F5D19|nr:hypothetical protein [Macrococcus bohemicus]QYA46080.1 hypothetical protein KYI13_12365 [Macrococcus bohemicus]
MTVKFNLVGKTLNDFTEQERELMSNDERKILRQQTKLAMKKNGYYNNVRKLRQDTPLDPKDKKDLALGIGIGIY